MTSFPPYLYSFIGIVFFLSSGWLSHDQSFSFVEPRDHGWQPGTSSSHHSGLALKTFSTPALPASVADLLTKSQDYHQQFVSVRGRITQLELHLDTTELYLDFVFRLTQEPHSIIVYGRHNRSLSAPPIVIHRFVEVTGIFWNEQDRNGVKVFNVLEAISMVPYPSSIPEST